MPSYSTLTAFLVLSYCLVCVACPIDNFPIEGTGEEISAFLARIPVTHVAAIEKDVSTSVNLKFRELIDPKQEMIGVRGREFIGFCEGRLRFDFPDWWETQFVKGRLSPEPWFNSPDADNQWLKVGGHDVSGIKSLGFVENSVYVVFSAGERIRIDRDVIAEIYHSYEDFQEDRISVSAAMSSDHCVLYSFNRVVCVRRSTGQVVWKRSLPHIVDEVNSSGIVNDFFSVHLNDSRVGCFRHDHGNIMFAILEETTGNVIGLFDSDFTCHSIASPSGDTDGKPAQFRSGGTTEETP